MGLFYMVSRSNSALSTTADLLTIQAAAGRSIKIHEIAVAGMGTASAANELGIFRQTALGATAATFIVPEKTNPALPASAFTANTAWTTQPAISAVALLRLGVNANGGVFRWVAKPGQEIELPGSATFTGALSLRSVVGASNVSIHIIVEEI